MGNRPSTLLPAAAAGLALAVGAYLRLNRFTRSRKTVTVPKPLPRKLAEFPQEILLEIFQAVHDTPVPQFSIHGPHSVEWGRYHQGTRGIQHLRLTCRLFDQLASEFLIKFVGVGLSSESLDRFRAIMEHPTIGRGVRMVQIRLPAYDDVLCRSLNRYAGEIRNYLYDNSAAIMSREARLLARRYATTGFRNFPVIRAQEMDPDIVHAHQEYRRRAEAQFLLPKQQFIREVVNTLKLSNNALRIEITDASNLIWRGHQSLPRATEDNVLDIALRPRPSSWIELETRDPGRSRSYAWMVPAFLLEALPDDRIRIADLRFEITGTTRSDRFWLGQAYFNLEPLRRAMRNLQSFSFVGGRRARDMDMQPDLSSLLLNCLPSASLRKLELVKVGLPEPHQFPNLTKISLLYITLNAKRLAHLLEPLEHHAVDLTLSCCSVMDGRWADVLDLLRAQQRKARLIGPTGQEFHDLPFPTKFDTNLERDLIMKFHDHFLGRSLQYIQGLYDTNPLRVLNA